MRSAIFIIYMLGLFTVTHAQQSDTTKTKDPVPPTEFPDTSRVEPVQPDTPVEQAAPKEDPSGSATSSDVANDNKPKIIYYQSGSSKDDGYERRYSSRYDKKKDIKTLAGTMNHSGGFGALSFRMTEFEDETMVLAGVRAGWIINRTLGIGFEGHGIIPTAQLSNKDPLEDVVALGGYGGMFLELIVLSNQVVHLTFPASAGAGWLAYSTDWESNSYNNEPTSLIDEDVFWYVEPGANIELNVSRNFRLDFGASKRFTQDMELINTNANAFEQLNYYVTLKIGGF